MTFFIFENEMSKHWKEGHQSEKDFLEHCAPARLCKRCEFSPSAFQLIQLACTGLCIGDLNKGVHWVQEDEGPLTMMLARMPDLVWASNHIRLHPPLASAAQRQ